MADLDQDTFRKFALIGAQARLSQLEAERAEILRAFPGLRSGRRGRPARIIEGSPSMGTPEPAKRRRRRTMSAEARKRISDRMKQRWAERRKKR